MNTKTNNSRPILGVHLVAAGDLILSEALQGFKNNKDYKLAKMLFENITVFEMLNKELAIYKY
ncbi:MAG: hypothetical protein OXE41_00175 [Gammaproteobacteria bacterium]|nr:hypothetical protein [Gammaproteobacteria bacterium]MCY4273808.1 hypothetical protein [Gammaproteobacteria bacterium]